MNKQIYFFALQVGYDDWELRPSKETMSATPKRLEQFANLIIQECLNTIETHKIPVGNSPAGELAFGWTYDSLAAISDSIREQFGVK